VVKTEHARPERETDRLIVFTQNAEATGAEVLVRDGEDEVLETVRTLIERERAGSLVLAAFCGALPENLLHHLRTIAGGTTGPTREVAARCAIGLTDAIAGVVSSGSVVIPVDSGMVALVSLLVRHQVVVLEESRLLNRPSEAIEQFASDFVFVTGPSATADMGALVRGVHGPHTMTIIVLRNRT